MQNRGLRENCKKKHEKTFLARKALPATLRIVHPKSIEAWQNYTLHLGRSGAFNLVHNWCARSGSSPSQTSIPLPALVSHIHGKMTCPRPRKSTEVTRMSYHVHTCP